MSPYKSKHIILGENFDKDSIFIHNDISNIVEFGNGKELYSFSPKILNKENLDRFSDEYSDTSLLINVTISSAITGLSRIYMSLFKNNPKINLYYSDTDSIYIEGNLVDIYPDLVGKGLGQLKPDYDFKEAVFLAPKVYGGITQEGESIVKAKGVKNIIPFDELKTLLQKGNKLIIPNEKWYRDVSGGNIRVKQEIYNLAIHSTKRELIYDNKGSLVSTKPFIVSEDDY